MAIKMELTRTFEHYARNPDLDREKNSVVEIYTQPGGKPKSRPEKTARETGEVR